MRYDTINGALTLLLGTGVGSTITIHMTQANMDTALRWGVFIVTIIVGVVKVYYMIKNEGKSKSD